MVGNQKHNSVTQMEEKTISLQLTKEDMMNIKKWITAASIMIEARVRTNWSESEQKTFDKLHKIEYGF